MTCPTDFWDALAPHHASLENNYLDIPSLGLVIDEIHEPVLVVGAGQGLIVAELLKRGFRTDGIDLSTEMIKYAKSRRGLEVIRADARSLPFAEGAYETIVYATGVVDFTSDEELIRVILKEAGRVASPSCKVFVAFYRISTASADLLTRLGLLKGTDLKFRETLEIYRLNPVQSIAWVAKKAGCSFFGAAFLSLRSFAASTRQERKAAFTMQKIFRTLENAASIIASAPETQPYRSELEIRNLFKRLEIPVKSLNTSDSCLIVQIEPRQAAS